LVHTAARLLRSGGYLIFEIGFNQKDRIEKLCKASPEMELLAIRPDKQNIPRTFVLRKKN
jgi:methylase of polypeptide subunit release factors